MRGLALPIDPQTHAVRRGMIDQSTDVGECSSRRAFQRSKTRANMTSLGRAHRRAFSTTRP